jgi:hypothetical protein
MQPLLSAVDLQQPMPERIHSTGSVVNKAALTSATFAALAKEDIAPEDVFFHKYMTLESVKRRAAANRAKKRAQAKQKARKEGDSEDVLPDDESSSEASEGHGASDGSESYDSAEIDAFLDTEEHLEVRKLQSVCSVPGRTGGFVRFRRLLPYLLASV